MEPTQVPIWPKILKINFYLFYFSRAKKKNSTEEVSVFVYDVKNGSEAKFELAKASMKRLKTLRHPSILQFLDSLETEKVLYVATESVDPLGNYVEKIPSEGTQKDLYLAWGIFQITVSFDIFFLINF